MGPLLLPHSPHSKLLKKAHKPQRLRNSSLGFFVKTMNKYSTPTAQIYTKLKTIQFFREGKNSKKQVQKPKFCLFDMGVSKNNGTPKSSHFNRAFHEINHPFWGF